MFVLPKVGETAKTNVLGEVAVWPNLREVRDGSARAADAAGRDEKAGEGSSWEYGSVRADWPNPGVNTSGEAEGRVGTLSGGGVTVTGEGCTADTFARCVADRRGRAMPERKRVGGATRACGSSSSGRTMSMAPAPNVWGGCPNVPKGAAGVSPNGTNAGVCKRLGGDDGTTSGGGDGVCSGDEGGESDKPTLN